MSTFEELLTRKNQGSLKIYLGYAAGVGKTYAMLEEGHILKTRGFEIVIGYVEPHARPETISLVEGFEVFPHKQLNVGDTYLSEMDIDAIIARAPKIVLIDELAHTNAAGSRNAKRYQDVLELLDHQINVIATLNVQHVESIANRVTNMVKVPVHERLPDNILQLADQIVMVDVSMEELRERLRLGKVYTSEKAEIALQNFFNYRNLSFLREVALREVARLQNLKTEKLGYLSVNTDENAEEPVMVAISSDPTSAEALIRKGIRIATQNSSRLYVCYVQRSAENPLKIDSNLQRKIQKNFTLAQSLGAEVVTLEGENVADILVNFAQEKHIAHAVFGKSRLTPLRERIHGSVLLDFIHDSVGIDVHIVTTELGYTT